MVRRLSQKEMYRTRLDDYAERWADYFTMRREDGILEVRMHTNGGPAEWGLEIHRAFIPAFADHTLIERTSGDLSCRPRQVADRLKADGWRARTVLDDTALVDGAVVAGAAGAGKILVTDTNPKRLELAKELGADAAYRGGLVPWARAELGGVLSAAAVGHRVVHGGEHTNQALARLTAGPSAAGLELHVAAAREGTR